MGRSVGLRALVGVCAAAALFVLSVGSASAQGQFHGIAFTKGCQTPTNVGSAYNCGYQMLNVVDQGQDTLQVTGLVDVVHSAGGDVNSGNILGALELVFSAPTVSCVGGSGAGTAASPYVGATSCMLPFGTSITTNSHSFYTVQAADFGLPGHLLTDSATLNWNNTCTAPGVLNCTTGAQTASAGSSTVVQVLPSSTATQIHNAAHQVVTTVGTGTTVHDFVAVSGQPGSPNPTGTVTIDWFLNGTCTGAPAVTGGPFALDASGQVDATAFSFTVNSAGGRGFLAHYSGDALYTPSNGACEPLTVVDANIQLNPPTATNRVGSNHVLTCHINVNDGTGFTNAPAGTTCTVTVIAGPGAPASQNCSTNASGDCQVTISSTTTGQSTIRASTDVTVSGVSLHRETGDAHPGDSLDASKLWANAAITIAPSATNEVGQPHTFTATLLFDTGAGLVPAGAGEPVTVTLTSANGATPVPAGPFNLTTNAAGQVTVTFTSATPGTVTGHASWTGSVSGSAPFTVETDGVAPNSGNAVKTFVDAYIEISPPVATNPLNVTHTYTAHVFVNDGSGAGYVNAPNGTVVTFTLLPGSVGHFVAGNTCTITNGLGTCTIDTTSSVAGDDTVQASTTLSVGGVSLTRTTGQPAPGHANSGNAVKHWVGGGGIIAPTQTTCNDVLTGTAQTLGQVNYSVVGGKIGQGINPGVFFFYSKITTTVPNQVVTVSQSNTSTNNTPLFQILNGQAWLWSGDCSKFTVGTLTANASGASFTVPVPGTYIIGIKYQTKSIAGAPAPVPADITFNFTTSLGGNSGASVLLKKQ